LSKRLQAASLSFLAGELNIDFMGDDAAFVTFFE
jgi:hypothetical protein